MKVGFSSSGSVWPRMTDREFVAYFHFVSFSHLSLGFHLDIVSPNIEIHLPFGFVRIGWVGIEEMSTTFYLKEEDHETGRPT
jgi:hypothetical protein